MDLPLAFGAKGCVHPAKEAFQFEFTQTNVPLTENVIGEPRTLTHIGSDRNNLEFYASCAGPNPFLE